MRNVEECVHTIPVPRRQLNRIELVQWTVKHRKQGWLFPSMTFTLETVLEGSAPIKATAGGYHKSSLPVLR